MSKEDELLHKWADERREGADIPTLKAENTALKLALSKAEERITKVEDRNTQLEHRVKELEASALKDKHKLPPE